MASPRELRQAIVEARADLQAAFHDAHDIWEKKPAGAQEGEGAWSPRQVAEPVIGAEVYSASGISRACGAPTLDRPPIDVSTPAAAAASLTRCGAIADNVLRHVSDADLAKTQEMRQGPMSVEQMMTRVAEHDHEHAQQIRAAAR